MNQTTTRSIPLLDLQAQYKQIQAEIEEAVISVLRSGHYVLGPQVKAFEEEAASFLGTRHAIGCANGSDALYLALLALDIKPGDEVITTPFTFVATAEAVTQAGAQPVFTDIDIKSFNIDPQSIEAKISNKTRAIIVVHLYGQACDMDAIMAIARKHNLRVIEDTAQAFGAKYNGHCAGTLADIGTYSFYPTKNLSCAGDGGMLSTNDDELAARLRRIRAHGSSRRYYHDELGVNSRLDEIQAAILRIKLKYIAEWNNQRARIAAIYDQRLSETSFEACTIITPQVIKQATHIYHQYTIRLDNPSKSLAELELARDQLKAELQKNNIASEIYYPLPLHLQKLYQYMNHQAEDFPNALKASKSILCLPIYPELADKDLNTITNAIILRRDYSSTN